MALVIEPQDLRFLPHGAVNAQDRERLLTFGFIGPAFNTPSGNLPANASVPILGPTGNPGHLLLSLNVVSTQDCRLELQISPDQGDNWFTCKSFASTANFDALYPYQVQIRQTAPRLFRVLLTNLTANDLSFSSDARVVTYWGDSYALGKIGDVILPAGNGLLNGLSLCAEANGANFTERVGNVNATLIAGASVFDGALQLSRALSQYATLAHNVAYQFSGSYTLMADHVLAAPVPAEDWNYLFSKGGEDPDELNDWSIFASANDLNDDPNTPSVIMNHTSPLHSVWGAEKLYTQKTGNRYVLFGYYDDDADTLTVRLYSATDAVIESSPFANPYDHGSYHSGQGVFFGSYGGLAYSLDGSMFRAASWGRVLSDEDMDAYWNSGVPLPFSAFTL